MPSYRLYHKTLFLLTSLSLVLQSACSSQQETYKKEAEAFCDVHKMERWVDYKNTGSFSDFQTELVARIQKVVVTEDFRNIFKKLSEDDSRPDPYQFIKTEIIRLTGSDWDCPEAEAIWSPKWSNTVDSNSGQAATRISIEIKKNGDYLLNDELIQAQHKDSLKSILLNAEISNSRVELIAGDGVSEQQVIGLLDTLSQLKVSKVEIKLTGKKPLDLHWPRQQTND